ncbi:hypothetical protein [Bradyrhizobium sp. ORS 111]|uniref:hypothetical protein n=1 Tax=Bradyrhizobium sp. ORS 111 TaxID=1685958 RepID=UPI00388DBD2C
MRSILFAIGVSIVMCGGARAGGTGDEGDGHTTVVHDANGTTVITQSGDPAKVELHVDRAPGRTTIYRQSGGNTAIVTQSSGTSAVPQDLPEWMRKLLDR